MLRSKGFTLLELIIVMVIIGVLSALAIPRFMNQSNNSKVTALNSTAAILTAACANNYSQRSLNSSNTATVAISDCSNVANIPSPTLPTSVANQLSGNPYTITALSISANTPTTCTISYANVTTTATFNCTGIS